MSETRDQDGAGPTEAPPVDPGRLPAWEVGDLPEPKPIEWRRWLMLIGPGIVLAGSSTGTGEYIIGPMAAARYHGAMLWVVLLSVLGQVVLNTEAMRYTLCTGEPVMTGFLRCKPGPRFWLAFYLVLDIGGWMPSQAGLAAQLLVVIWKKLGPTDVISPGVVQQVSIGVFFFCALLSLFGGKVYSTLKWVLGGKFLFVLVFMVGSTLFTVSAGTWADIWGGLIDPTRVPQAADGEIDWALIAGLAGLSGVGGLGNILVSNYVRENAWGMGAKVGAIPSAFGGVQIELSHIGTITRGGEENARRFRGWMKYLVPDQWFVWAVGSLVGVVLPCLLGAEYLRAESLVLEKQWQQAAALAQDFGLARGEFWRNMTLICGLVILIPGQFGTIDQMARRWTDAVWSGSRRARRMDVGRVRLLYYGFAATYVFLGMCVFLFIPNLSGTSMMKIASNLANLAIACTIFHTLYVNRRFLPVEMRPSIGKQIALFLAGVFFATMFALVVNQKILPVVKEQFGW